jgi:hypothetical protein
MEFIEGETLELAVTHVDAQGRTVPARPLPAEEIVRHAIRLCQVLEYLGERPTPVIHHDIKPANLIVDGTSGEVRLVDFGTAQTRFRRATQMHLDRGQSALFGTEGYAAPEQYQGRSEPRSDVYALAATVYHLLTDQDPGAEPFHFPHLADVPGPLGDALERALRPEVQRRSTAQEFRQALEAWLLPETGGQPFVFGNGAVARTTEELVRLCDRHWIEARRHLAAGDFDHWFRARNRHDLVAKARSARLQTDADAALETFLHRLNPRLAPPRLKVVPEELDFGGVRRDRPALQHITLCNETRGYAQATFTASVPWLGLPRDPVGCLAGDAVQLAVAIDPGALPFRREHHALLTCAPTRGARISIPVTARLNLAADMLRRAAARLSVWGRIARRGAQQGLDTWSHTFLSLARSRSGLWVLLAEIAILDIAMVALWWIWRGLPLDLLDLVVATLRVLPLALLAVYVLPALVFVGGAVVWENIKALFAKEHA